MSDIRQQTVLHIVSDNLTAETLRKSDIGGDILAWQDALYEGPVPSTKSLDELCEERARYFAARSMGEYSDISEAYKQRNQVLKSYINYTKVVLWFDIDLYGQLQLIQLIAWFDTQNTGKTEITQIESSKIPAKGSVKRHLFQLNSIEIAKLYQSASEVTMLQAEISTQAWQAFTAKTPEKLLSFYRKDLSSMPTVKNALLRLAQEYPSKATGLSRTESLIIEAVRQRHYTEGEIFEFVQKKEPLAFMTQPVFLYHLNHLINARYPVLKKEVLEYDSALEVASDGVNDQMVVHDYKICHTNYTNQVLNKWVDWIQLNGINRWIGGVHLNEGNIWRYDAETRSIKKTYI
ncbi:MAG: hypothetical protein R3240_03050 [Gammaproteobacteria bacterium]|nr:hypothetical protein [Gammaproteobacteria bacterium]